MNMKIIVVLALVSMLLASCSAAATPCPFSRNPGPPPAEVEKRARDAFFALGSAGIRGTLKVEADGEYSCDHFAVEFVNFSYTLYIADLNDQTMIKDYVAKVRASAKESVQGWNMGTVRVSFVAGNRCNWDDQQNACAPIEALFNAP